VLSGERAHELWLEGTGSSARILASNKRGIKES
jgi:hypothetical protein